MTPNRKQPLRSEQPTHVVDIMFRLPADFPAGGL
jgi:hypothetical protein